MKVILTAFALLLFTVTCTLQPIFAEDSTSSPTIKRPIPLEKKIERLETMQEKMATRAANLKAKLANFRDKKKASAAARINDNLAKVNTNRTTEMLNHLNRLSDILSRLETRVNGLTGVDSTSVTAAIATAKTAIDTAKAAVTVQSQKDYTITVTTESKVRADATKEREMLHTDLQATHSLVMTAVSAVGNAITEAIKLGGSK